MISLVVCDTAKVRFFKQITTETVATLTKELLFAILQKYDFSSKSQQVCFIEDKPSGCLRYCKSTIFQANHNPSSASVVDLVLFAILQKYDFSSKSQQKQRPQNIQQVVCDTAKVRFFKQITTTSFLLSAATRCLRYCKSTIFQANHNSVLCCLLILCVVCDTAKVRFFKQITTKHQQRKIDIRCLRYCKSTIFQANHNPKTQ